MARRTKADRRRAALKGIRNKARRRNGAKEKASKRISSALKKYVERMKGNPSKVKGHKVKGGRGVSLRGFTGTVVRLSNGQIAIRGKGRR